MIGVMTSQTCATSRVNPYLLSARVTLSLLLSSALGLSGCGGEADATFDDLSFAPNARAVAIPPPSESNETSSEARPTQLEYVRTEKDPFSTFAADVDSASYDLFVSSLKANGQLPPSKAYGRRSSSTPSTMTIQPQPTILSTRSPSVSPPGVDCTIRKLRCFGLAFEPRRLKPSKRNPQTWSS